MNTGVTQNGPAPAPEEAELLDELARVEHEIEALGEYRDQLRARVNAARRTEG